jgi:hypothetical protein
MCLRTFSFIHVGAEITRHRFSNLYTSPRWNNTAPRALSLGVYRKSDNPLVCAARGFLAVTNSQSYEGFDAMRDRLLTFVGNSRCSDGHRCYILTTTKNDQKTKRNHHTRWLEQLDSMNNLLPKKVLLHNFSFLWIFVLLKAFTRSYSYQIWLQKKILCYSFWKVKSDNIFSVLISNTHSSLQQYDCLGEKSREHHLFVISQMTSQQSDISTPTSAAVPFSQRATPSLQGSNPSIRVGLTN